MVLDSDALFCGRITLCGSYDAFGYFIQAVGSVECGDSSLYELALFSVGNQALVESVCRFGTDQTLVDCRDAAADRRRLMAFGSATHDIAADGFYMLGLNEEKQAFFIGIRNTFYRVAMITGQ